MKIRKFIFLFIFIFVLGLTNVYADTINSIDLEMYIDKDGNAEITERWHVTADSGTEWFKQLYDIRNF